MPLVNLSAVVEASRNATGPSPGPGLALTDAYDALPIDVERAICAYETRGEALVEAVRVLTGRQAHLTYFASYMVASFAAPEGWFFDSRARRDGTVDWEAKTVGHRSAIVRGSLTRVGSLIRTVDAMVRGSNGFVTPERALEHVQPSLPLWWVARLDEGHTPESARVLLGLLISPLAWPHLHWPADPTLPPSVAPKFISDPLTSD